MLYKWEISWADLNPTEDLSRIGSLGNWQCPPGYNLRCLSGYTINKWLYSEPTTGEKQEPVSSSLADPYDPDLIFS